MTKTLWIDGWACNSEFKKAELSKHLNTNLEVLSFKDWIQDLNNQNPIDTSQYQHIIFWSTACFAPIHFGKTKSQCIFLFPAFDYCAKNGWNSTAITRMQRSISKGKVKETLNQFSSLLGQGIESEIATWNDTALQEPELLINGLELLKTNLKQPLPEFSQIIIGKNDSLCKPEPIKAYSKDQNLSIIELDSEHWPFHSKAYKAIASILEK